MARLAAADEVFHALGNPTRRKVLERLSVSPATVSELAASFDMQLPSFVQHLSVLEQSRLVNAKLVLLLANHVGDPAVLRAAMAAARADVAPAPRANRLRGMH